MAHPGRPAPAAGPGGLPGEPRLGGQGQPQPGVGLLQLAQGEAAQGGHDGQLRGGPHPVAGQPRHQLPEHGRLSFDQHRRPARDQEGGRLVEVAGGQGVADGGHRLAVAGVPAGRPAVQLRQLGGVLVAQLGPEQLGEQRVVAVPGPVGADRGGEHVLALQPGQHPGPVGAAGQGVGQVAAEALGHRRPQQERPQLGGLGGQHLLDQVAGDGPVVAGQVGHEPLRPGMGPQRQRGQPQPGRPALGPAAQRLELAGGQHHPVVLEQLPGLLQGEGQLGLPDLAELPGHPQPVQGQGRVGAGGHDQAELWRGVAEQEPELADHGLAARLVQVVQDQHHRAVELGQAADEGAQEPVADLELRVEAGQEPVGPDDPGPVQGGQHMGPEPPRMVVARGRPAPRPPGPAVPRPDPRGPPRGPGGEQQGLAVAGGRGQQGHGPLGRVVQQGEQPLAGDRPPTGHRHHQLGGEQPRGVRLFRCVRELLPARPNPPLGLLLTGRETVEGGTQASRKAAAIPCHCRSP